MMSPTKVGRGPKPTTAYTGWRPSGPQTIQHVQTGEFADGNNGWLLGGTWVISLGLATVTAGGSLTNTLVAPLTPGGEYTLTFNITVNVLAFNVNVSLGGPAQVLTPQTGLGTKTINFTATGASTTLVFQPSGLGLISIANVSLMGP